MGQWIQLALVVGLLGTSCSKPPLDTNAEPSTDAELRAHAKEDPQALNRYAYARNNPIMFNDPSGHFFGKVFKAIGKAFKDVGKAIGSSVALKAVAWAFVPVAAQYFDPSTRGPSIIGGAAVVGFVVGGPVGSQLAGKSAAGLAFWGAVGGGISGGITGGTSSRQHANKTRESLEKSSPDPSKSSPGASKIEPAALQDAILKGFLT